MPHGSPTHRLTFGYLSVVRSVEHGYFGGYLVISALGRPLEFHCSAPVRPSRAQEILYGPTLEPYLLGELIGSTLLGRAKTSPCLIVTDQPAAMCLRTQIDVPLVQLVPQIDAQAQACDDEATGDRRIVVNDRKFDLAAGFLSDREAALNLLAELAVRVNLAEPFDRIHEAIREAQRIGSRDQDAYGQAA
jgi:hypothetical protein